MTTEPYTATVQVSTPLEKQQIQYVAEYCGLRQSVAVEDSSQLRLQLPSGEAVTTRNAILREVVKESKIAADLLGDQPLADALIWEWLTFCNNFSLSAQADLQKIHDHLSARTYLATQHKPSLADLVLATLVHRPVKNFPSGQAAEYRNLVRWYDLIQHTTPLTAHFPEASIQKPSIPAPPAVIPPAKEKAKASDAAAAKAQAAAKEPVQPTPALDSKAKPSDAAFTQAQNGQVSGGKAGSKAGKAGMAGQQGTESSPAADSPASAPATPSQPAEAPAEGKGKKAGKADKAGKPAAAAKADAEPEFDALDVRVGKILSVDKHPNAESLYVESIDIGEDKPRQVVSGLVKFVAKEAMQDRLVLVVCNMKPAKMRDVMSYGMVLCASNAAHDQVDPLKPADGTVVGEKVQVQGFEGEPEAQLNPKKKVFEKVAAHFQTSTDGTALYKDRPFQTAAGDVTSSISEGSIS